MQLKKCKEKKIKDWSTIFAEQDFLKFDNVNNIYNIKTWAICLDEFTNNPDVIEMHNCNHIFHKEWILKYQSMNIPDKMKQKWPLWKSDLKSNRNSL